MAHCIACGYSVSYPFFHPEDQPLAALYLPPSAVEARNIARYPLDFHACARCGHVYNIAFDYARVPYANNSNLMYNTGSGWQEYMDGLADHVTAAYKHAVTWLEIGCGDGHFLERIQKRLPHARVIGYEPGVEAKNAAARGVDAREDYFIAERDLPRDKPDILLCRHVIEHLPRPQDFVADIAYWCNRHQIFPVLIAEVPCIDKAIASGRINDYLYEHVSNFTARSFRAMFEAAGFEVLEMTLGYGDEVMRATVRPRRNPDFAEILRHVEKGRDALHGQIAAVRKALLELKSAGQHVVFWGGTGKSAAFLNNFNLNAEEFPHVVDSDMQKVGRFVPSMAQEIQAPESITAETKNAIIITTQWRARDIYAEIQRRGLPHAGVYVVLNQRLMPYAGEEI